MIKPSLFCHQRKGKRL